MLGLGCSCKSLHFPWCPARHHQNLDELVATPMMVLGILPGHLPMDINRRFPVASSTGNAAEESEHRAMITAPLRARHAVCDAVGNTWQHHSQHWLSNISLCPPILKAKFLCRSNHFKKQMNNVSLLFNFVLSSFSATSSLDIPSLICFFKISSLGMKLPIRHSFSAHFVKLRRP